MFFASWSPVPGRHRPGHRLALVYLLLAGIVTCLLAVLTPPFLAPDEPNHVLRELQIADGHLFAEASSAGAGGTADCGLLPATSRIAELETFSAKHYPVSSDRPDGRMGRDDLWMLQHLRWAHTNCFYLFPNTAAYPPLLYLPQVAGWTFARHLDLSIANGLLCARLCAAFTAVLIGAFALAWTACCEREMFLLLLLPTCLSLNASASQDAILFSTFALAVACLSRPLVERRGLRSGELIAGTVLLTICAGGRLPYLLLLLALFLPALDAPVMRLRALLAPAAATTFAWLLAALWERRTRGLGVALLKGANPGRQTAFLLTHPWHGGLILLKATVLGSTATVLKGLARIGTNDATPPKVLYGLFVLALLLLVVQAPAPASLHRVRARGVVLTIVAAVAFAVALAEYLIWSVPGAGSVEGLQSRYYLPLLMLLLLALPTRPLLRLPRRVGSVAVLSAYVAVLACVLAIPVLAAHRFYNSDLLPALQGVVR